MKKMIIFFATLLIIVSSFSSSSAQSIESYMIAHSYDVCGTYMCQVRSSGYVAGQTIKIYWGDGSDTTELATSWITDTAITAGFHQYTTPGVYSIKMVLYDGGPVDSVTVSQDIRPCNFISIFAMVDVNGNCVRDSMDEWVRSSSSIKVDSAGIPIDTLVICTGMWYRASAPAGTIYTFSLISPPSGLALACASSGIIHDTIPPSPFDIIPTKYLLFDCTSTSSAFDLNISASTIASRSIQRASIAVTNSSCTGTPALLRFDHSPKFAFNSIDPAYTYTISGTSVTFDIGTVTANTTRFINILLDSATTLVLGDTANSTFTVTPISGDTNPANNVLARCDTIRASYDPNRKSVSPTGNITAGTTLEYMLEFENTGNDTAYNIHILDTLSDYLDINTLKGGISTHRMALYSYKVAGQNILKFDFPSIMLPDSSHHDVCKGMVTFSINAKTTLSPGTTIANRVGIYFDVNEVVMTNTVYSGIPLPTNVKSIGLSKVELYPNPVTETLNVIVEGGNYSRLTIYNVMGQVVHSQEVTGTLAAVNVSSLAQGIYYCSLQGEKEKKTIKFEKL
jgi:uncharacterized repeat protein (TIGR01451 family)